MTFENPPPSEDQAQPFRVEGRLVDPAACRVERAGKGTHVEPKAMRVLTYLVHRNGQVVSRQELEDQVWEDTVVGHKAVTNTIIKLRKVLGDDARHPRIIETIPKRGYRLLAEVTPAAAEDQTRSQHPTPASGSDDDRKANCATAPLIRGVLQPTNQVARTTGRFFVPATVLAALVVAVAGLLAWWQPWQPPVESEPPERMAYPLPDEPSIAVLPFDNLSSQASGGYLADAITETLITTLGQDPELFVIARHSALTYKGEAVEARKAGRELGVEHILTGSLQQNADTIRVTAQLVDAKTGEHLWAQRYERPIGDLFALQDDIAFNVLISLQRELTQGADAVLSSSSTDSVQAYLKLQKAKSSLYAFTKDAMVETRRLVDEALEFDPDYDMARIVKAWTYIEDVRNGYTDSSESALAAAEAEIDELGRINHEPATPNVVEGQADMTRACVALLRGQYDLAVEHAERTIELLPNSADMLANYGYILIVAGKPERAVEPLERAIRLNPRFESWQARALSTALTLRGDHDAAIAMARQGISHAESDRNRAFGHMVLAIAYADQGMLDRAEAEAERAHGLAPYMTVEWFRSVLVLRNEEDSERVEKALRVAGVPE